jgi:hypothetical protein
VSAASLPSALLGELSRFPQCAVVKDGQLVERLVRRPVTVVGVIAEPGRWTSQAEALGRFVTIARRAAIRSPQRRPSARVSAEASMWGIGLISETPDGVAILAYPAEPKVELRPYEWWLAEILYDAWLAGEGSRVTPTPQSAA